MRRPTPFLWKSRHGIYYFRLLTPKAAKAANPELKREFRCSLKTRCPKEALSKAQSMWAVLYGDPSAINHPRLSELLTRASGTGTDNLSSDRCFSKEMKDMSQSQRTFNITLSRPFEESDIGLYGFKQNSVSAKPEPEAPKGRSCSELFKLFTQDQVSSNCWSLKTRGENTAIHSLFTRICGDLPISAYNREQLVYFKQTIQKLPKNLNKDPRFKGRRVAEILRMREIEPLDVLTVNKYLARTTAFFSWCQRNNFIEHNPADRLSIRSKKHPRDHRDDFTSEELQMLFMGDVYQPGVKHIPYRFWLPLLGIYTGARLDELCQLYTDDIRQISGIWCFSFNNDGLKKLKNLSSIRTIPIHSKLVELGFLNFVSHRRERNDLRIFPELPWKELDGYQRNASKWFSDYRRRCGIVSAKKTFHSFRHTVSNHLKQRGCIAEQVSSLLGHATESITFDRYGKEYCPEVMRRVVEQLDYGVSFHGILRTDVNPYLQCPMNTRG